MPGSGNQRNALPALSDLNSQPSVAWVSHVGADDAVHNLFPIGMIPHDASHADVCTEFDKSLPSEPV
jgi:hypothetical protein